MAIAVHHANSTIERAGTAASGSAIAAGIVAGLIAGLGMILTAMIRSAALGRDFFGPLYEIGATYYGPNAMNGGFGPALWGAVTHFATAAVLGLIFGLVVGRRWTIGAALGLGLIWGVIIWAAMTWIALPLFNVPMREAVLQVPGWWFAYHLIFGALLLFTPPLAAAFSGQPMNPEPLARPGP